MAMNIKNVEAGRLARELAALTGETITESVTRSLAERLERVRARPDEAAQLAEALLSIGRDVAGRLPPAVRDVDHGELLYDEAGLPR